jgi:hypothetical protein
MFDSIKPDEFELDPNPVSTFRYCVSPQESTRQQIMANSAFYGMMRKGESFSLNSPCNRFSPDESLLSPARPSKFFTKTGENLTAFLQRKQCQQSVELNRRKMRSLQTKCTKAELGNHNDLQQQIRAE